MRPCKVTFNDHHYLINADGSVLAGGQDNITETALGYAVLKEVRRLRTNKARRERHQAMLDAGLVRVRGTLGGVYYE